MKTMMIILTCGLSVPAICDTFGTSGLQFSIDFVVISAATNPQGNLKKKAVEYDYRIGKYEITNSQWNTFKVLYGTPKGDPATAYERSTYYGSPNVPTNNVSWYEAVQFVNWLNVSTGHSPAYKFSGTQGESDYKFEQWNYNDVGYNAKNKFRNTNAYYFLPTDNEWVKAAYWNGSVIQTYSNKSASDLICGFPHPCKWNYLYLDYSGPWAVGSGGQELNGTFDMMGNVEEWTETIYPDNPNSRILRGGVYYAGEGAYGLDSSCVGGTSAFDELSGVGFRIASIPEPAALSLIGLGLLTLRRKF